MRVGGLPGCAPLGVRLAANRAIEHDDKDGASGAAQTCAGARRPEISERRSSSRSSVARRRSVICRVQLPVAVVRLAAMPLTIRRVMPGMPRTILAGVLRLRSGQALRRVVASRATTAPRSSGPGRGSRSVLLYARDIVRSRTNGIGLKQAQTGRRFDAMTNWCRHSHLRDWSYGGFAVRSPHAQSRRVRAEPVEVRR